VSIELQFDEAARARVAEAVRRAEALSRGQIVPAVVGKSDPYPEARWRGGLLAVALVTVALLGAGVPVAVWELPLFQLAAGILGALVASWDPVERLLAGQRAMDEAVRARALRAFHEHGLQRTEEGTGVLVFASLFEREAVILGDHGIHAKMGDDWNQAVAALVAGLRADDAARGFVDAIAVCGARLAEHFPRDPSSRPPRNELEDQIRTSAT
jgi:putative membrane protein